MVKIELDDNYWIEVGADDELTGDKDQIVVYGCDCADSLSDPAKVEQLRDALTAWLERNANKASDHGE